MSLISLWIVAAIALVTLAFIVFYPSFFAWRVGRRKAFVESVMDQMTRWDRRFMTNTDESDSFIAVTTEEAYDEAINRKFSSPVFVWPTFVFSRPGGARSAYEDGTTEYLDYLYGEIVKRVTRYNRGKFTDEEFALIVKCFVRQAPHLFVPGTGTPEENAKYDRLYKPTLPGGAGVFINARRP